MTTLTPEEKKIIAEQHLKTVLFSEYNISLSLMESNAIVDKNQTNIDALNSQMAEVLSQKNVLQSELNLIEAEIASQTA
jgi:hypothetical protein